MPESAEPAVDHRSPEPAARALEPGAASPSLSPQLLRLAFLQGTAGNRAVTQLLGRRLGSVQRQTPPPAPEPGVDPPGPRLKSAAAAIKAGTLDDRIWQLWKPTGTKRDAILEQLWVDDLALPDVDPKTVDAKLRKTAKQVEADLGTRITTVLAKQLAAMDKELTTPDAIARVGTLVEEVAGQGKGWSGQGLVDVLWPRWVGPGEIGGLGAAKQAGLNLYERLKGVAEAKLTGTKAAPGFRMTTFSDTANAALDKKEVAAVKDAAGARIGYVVGTDALADLTDDVMGRLGTPKPRTAPEWTALNGRMRRLLIVAETDLANSIPHDKKVDLWPERWAEMRDRYVNTTTKTIWRYWKEDVVDFTFLGIPFKTSTANVGLHRDVAEVIKRVETSAIRLSGLKDAKAVREDTGTKSSKQNSLPGSEFRFEAVAQHPWMLGSAHLSYHGTGRALDIRAATNPPIKGDPHTLIGILGGEELSGDVQERLDARTWATKLSRLPAHRKELEQEFAAAAESDKAEAKARLDAFDVASEKASETGAEATSLRDRATTAWERVTNVEAAFQSAWSTLKGETKTNDELAAKLLELVDAEIPNVQTEIDGLGKGEWRQKAVLQERLGRIRTLRATLAATTKAGKAARDAMLGQVEKANTSGLTDMPLWLVQAFAENGWHWGANFGGFSDAMHFDYMGPVSGVLGP